MASRPEASLAPPGFILTPAEAPRHACRWRALADASPLLIPDEAALSLDSELESLIQQAMERLMKGRTSIVIASFRSTAARFARATHAALASHVLWTG